MKFRLFFVVFLVFLQSSYALADVMIHGAKARATFAMAKTGAAYAMLHNNGKKAVTLTQVTVDESVADEAQIHNTLMQDGMMRMRQLTAGVDIQPGAMVEFKPGSYHIMLMGLQKALNAGESFEMVLHFSDGTAQTVTVAVVDMNNDTNSHQHHH